MRVCFLIDGFNLYHSVRAAEHRLGGGPLRWLDLPALCSTLLSSTIGPGAKLTGIHYFSALASHLESKKPEVVKRHRTYLAALKAHGVSVYLAKFKKKDRKATLDRLRIQIRPFRRSWRIPISWVRVTMKTHEEKETDVAIAVKLFELLHRQDCEAVILMTGDTDLAPAIRMAKKLFPASTVSIAFPYARHNRELQRLAPTSVKISAALYRKHQFPSVLTTPSGRRIIKPDVW